jgi:hypothetical protein
LSEKDTARLQEFAPGTRGIRAPASLLEKLQKLLAPFRSLVKVCTVLCELKRLEKIFKKSFDSSSRSSKF